MPTDEARERGDPKGRRTPSPFEDDEERDTIPAPPWADEPIETDDSDVD